MRVNIKTKGKVIDQDIRALYLINEAIKLSTPRMVKANLDFVLGKYNLTTAYQLSQKVK